MNVQHYLDQLGPGTTKEEFLTTCPHRVLVETEGQDAGTVGDGIGPTKQLNSDEIRRQSLSSREAKVYPLDMSQGTLTVGRALDCGVVLQGGSVSKHHARFSLKGDTLLLEDLGSTNGTYHNQSKLDPGQQVRLFTDDTILFGRTRGLHLLEPGGFYDYLKLLQRFSL